MKSAAPVDSGVRHCIDPKVAPDWAAIDACIRALHATPAAPVHSALDLVEGTAYAQAPDPSVIPAWQIPSWFINNSTGSDNATCVDSSHPCKTFGGIVQRWKTTEPILNQATTITFQVDDTAEDIFFDPRLGTGGSATILGTPTTVLGSLTLSGVVPKLRTRAGPPCPGVTCPLLQASWSGISTAHQGLMVVNATRGNSVAWVDSVSGGVAVLTQPMVANVPAFTTFPAEVDTWANGDSISLQRPTKVSMRSFRPVTATGDVSGDSMFGFAGNVWITDAVSPGTSFFPVSTLVRFAQARVDSFLVHNDAVLGEDGGFINVWAAGGGQVLNLFIAGGAVGTLGGFGFNSTGLWDGDVILHSATGAIVIPFNSEHLIGAAYLDNITSSGGLESLGNVFLSADAYGVVALYGTYKLDSFYGIFAYDAAPSSAFLGTPTFACNNIGFANAYDPSVTPAQWYPARSFTLANLGASVASGGFGGLAYCDDGSQIVRFGQATATPSPVVWPPGNGGTGLDAGCPAGEFLGGNPFACSTPSGTGIAGVNGVSGVACSGSPTVTCSNTDPGSAISVAAGTNITSVVHTGSTFTVNAATQGTASCPINLASCVTGTLAETAGGTAANLTGCGADSVFFQNAGQFGCILPLPGSMGGTNQTGLPLTEPNGGTNANLTGCPAGAVFIQGASQFNCVSTLGAPAGGSGISSPTPHAVLLGENASPFGLATIGTAGNVLTDNGAGADPSFQAPAVSMSRFLSGQFAGSATLGGIGLHTLANVTLTTGTSVMVFARFEFTSSDTINNSVTYGVTVGSCASIAFPSTGMVPSGSFFGFSPSVLDYERILRFSGLVAGSNSFCFLAAMTAPATSTNPGGSVEGLILF